MTDVSIARAIRGLILLACLPIVVWCSGCNMTPMQKARTIVAASAEAVVGTDRVIAPRYAAAVAGGDQSEIRAYNAAVETLLLARATIMAAERSLDAAEAAGDGEVPAVIACIVSAVQRLIDVLPSIGVDMPQSLTVVLSMASAFADGVCDAHLGETTEGIPHASEVLP